jgi:S-DNA-T family DNA segregation ATPase FtsK/SpoIIIE
VTEVTEGVSDNNGQAKPTSRPVTKKPLATAPVPLPEEAIEGELIDPEEDIPTQVMPVAEAPIFPPPADPTPKKQRPLAARPLLEELAALEEENKRKELFEDELMPEAIAMVRQLNKASTSLLQRRFRIGYTRAARMIDAMEEMNIIGPPTGTSKAREVMPWQDDNGEPESESEIVEEGE